jgi:hypothetical protein
MLSIAYRITIVLSICLLALNVRMEEPNIDDVTEDTTV